MQTKRRSKQVTDAAPMGGASRLPADTFPADSEQFLKRILASAPVAISVMKGPDLRFTLVNDAYQAILGGDTQFVGRTYRDLFPQAADRGAEEWLRNVMRTGEEWNVRDFETEIPGREGMTWWDGECLPLSNEHGEFDSVLVLTWEITDRKLAEQGIRESEERFRLAQSIARVGTFELNIQSGLNIWTPELEAMYGLKPGEFARTQAAWEDLVHPDDRAGALARVDEALHTGEPTEHEWRVIWPDGGVHWVAGRFQCFGDAEGAPLLLSGVNIDITDRKRAEEALRESEERFARFMQQHPGLAWIKDANGRYVYANEAAEKAFQTPREKLYGKTDDEIFPAQVAAQFAENDRRALGSESGVQVVETLEHDDGVLHHSIVSKFPIPGRDGRPTLIGGMAIDITEHRQAEQALRESEARLRAVVETAVDGIITIDDKGLIQSINPAAVGIFGFEPAEVIGQNIRLLMPPPYREEHDGYIRSYLDTGVRKIIGIGREVAGRRRNGSIFPMELAVSETKLEDRVLFIGIVRDVTMRKEAQEALRESEERFRNMANSAPVMIWVTEPDASCSFLSKSWFEFTGQAVEEALGFGWLEAVHPDDREEVTQTALDRNERRGSFRVEYRLCRHDGEYRWMLASAAPRVGPAREFLGYIGSIIDITERREIEQELRRANAAKDEFLGLVSHELRTPITTILGMSHVLRSRADSLSREEQQMSLEDIANDAQRLDRIVRNLLILARLEEGQVPEMEPLLLGKILSRLVHEQKRRSRRKITLDIAGDPPVTGHADYIEQIARNLLSNAEKYGSASTPVKVALRLDGEFACVSVSDRGRGIPEAEREAIFAPFFRSESTQGFQGIGIGLAVCRRLAEAMGGRIWVEPREGGGSTFAFTLPVYHELT